MIARPAVGKWEGCGAARRQERRGAGRARPFGLASFSQFHAIGYAAARLGSSVCPGAQRKQFYVRVPFFLFWSLVPKLGLIGRAGGSSIKHTGGNLVLGTLSQALTE